VTHINRLNGRIVQLERQRDELQLLNFKLRDKLLEIAKECSECGGTGCVTLGEDRIVTTRVVPCPDCADIRQALEP
jgi:transposase